MQRDARLVRHGAVVVAVQDEERRNLTPGGEVRDGIRCGREIWIVGGRLTGQLLDRRVELAKRSSLFDAHRIGVELRGSRQ